MSWTLWTLKTITIRTYGPSLVLSDDDDKIEIRFDRRSNGLECKGDLCGNYSYFRHNVSTGRIILEGLGDDSSNWLTPITQMDSPGYGVIAYSFCDPAPLSSGHEPEPE
jgi:hypothetical protein